MGYLAGDMMQNMSLGYAIGSVTTNPAHNLATITEQITI
jgi:hypothetical protein